MKLSDIACHISGVKRCNWRCFLGEAAEVHSLVEEKVLRSMELHLGSRFLRT